MKFRWQFVLTVISLLFSIPLLVWGFWPPRRETVTVPLVTSAGMPSLPGRTIRLTFSPEMRDGDSQIVELDISAGSDSPSNYDVIAEARLDLLLADIHPAEAVSAALTEGHGATFYWEAAPRETGTLRGTVWLFLRFIPKAGSEETRQPVSAQLVEIRSKSMLGRTGSEARVWGVGGMIIGLVLAVLSRRVGER